MKTKLAFAALLSIMSNADASCASSYCTVNTQWDTQGLRNNDGLRIDLRYTYAKADTPRLGSAKVVNDPALAAPGDEVENMQTLNQGLIANFNYALNHQWNMDVGVPLVMLDHAHTIAPATIEQNKFSRLGDIRIVGNYQTDAADALSGNGLRLGIKLPTGETSWDLVPGGGAAERSLQPGSGSTDVILGAYRYREAAHSPWGWFVSGQIQAALNTRDNYRPGNDIAIDLGAHYTVSPKLTALLQLNTQFKQRDSGINANLHSGGHSVNLNPGLSFALTDKARVYGFVQLPLYQYANTDPAGGLSGQLTAPWSASLGISRQF